MIKNDRLDASEAEPHSLHKKDDIDIIIRKRPIFESELVDSCVNDRNQGKTMLSVVQVLNSTFMSAGSKWME